LVRHLYQPAFVLAPPPSKKKSAIEATNAAAAAAADNNERSSSVLFVNYCPSEDQHWLLASCCDDRGEMIQTVVINVDIPNKTRRKKASARRVGLRKLMNWILGVMSQALVPWRLVIGRIGRIGHGELRGWSVLLGRKALKKASKQLREMCAWQSDVPAIMSACLVSMEPDSTLRVMSDQFTPDERFGQTASNCQLSTPKDASCTHILVFPTSATAQSSQKAFEDHQEGLGSSKDDLDDFGLPDMDLEGELDAGGNDLDLGMDIFSEDFNMGGDQPGSPGSPGKRNSMSQPNSPSAQNARSGADIFRYGQEEPGERIEILQQPLALGYLVSTAKTGQMPKWFWSACPHLENVCPVFLKSALHINQASVLHGGDDGYTPHSSSGRVHSLDSSYTTDVLRYVLEGYNSLSWLSLDSVTHDRRSCMPLHVQLLQQMYTNLSSLV
jgi:mediator of RNA polymerase II transcription subunit 13